MDLFRHLADIPGVHEAQAASSAPHEFSSVMRWKQAPESADHELVLAVRDGSEKAIGTLVRRHWDLMHRSAYLVVQDSAAAEDIAQDSILAALGALDRFDATRPLSPWLNRIAVNNALKWLRSPARREDGDAPRRRAGQLSVEE